MPRRGGVAVELDGAVDAFLDYAATERGLARKTIEAYARDLAAFTRFAVERGTRAPGRLAETWSVGKSTLGRSLTASFW